jgi:undecaprenyl-diphosphatase
MFIYLIIGTLPAAIIGLLFKDKIEQAFQSPRLVCIMLICTGFILLSTFKNNNGTKRFSILNVLLIGLAQAVAILPGISRSGSTISAGLQLKINREKAASFSFLLSIPAILGATLLKLKDLLAFGISGDFFAVLAVGTIASYITGYIAIETLLKIVRKGKLFWFAPYCILLGLIGLILL